MLGPTFVNNSIGTPDVLKVHWQGGVHIIAGKSFIEWGLKREKQLDVVAASLSDRADGPLQATESAPWESRDVLYKGRLWKDFEK